MDLDIEKLKGYANKSKTVVLSLGLGVAAVAGASILDDGSTDIKNDLQDKTDSSSQMDSIDTEIDENRNRLDTLSNADSDNGVDYTRLGC